jgi:hypothetical protein
MLAQRLAIPWVIAALIASYGASSNTDLPLQFTAVPSPASPNSGQPQLSTSSRGVILSWIDRTGESAALRFAERTPTGWSEPRTVASGTDWFVNWADVPSVMRLDDGTLAAHWLQKSGPGTYAYDVKLSFSTDDGRTWSAPTTPHHDGAKSEHGFASLFQMPGAGLGLVWLDGRAMTGGHGGGHGGGEMSLRFSTFGKNRQQNAEMVVDGRVCECCPTTAAVTSEGVIAAYRDRSAEEVRDIHVSRLENGKWTESVAVHADNWKIAACPVNGPVLATSGKTVAIAWFTIKNEKGQAYAAFSQDAGRSFSAPVRLDDAESLGRVDIELLPDGSALAAYIDASGEKPQLRIRRVAADATRSQPVSVAAIESTRTSGYPRIAIHGAEVVAAWIERDGTPRVKTAAASLKALLK